MKSLSDKTAAFFSAIFSECNKNNGYLRIDNSKGKSRPLVVERVGENQNFIFYSVANCFTQNLHTVRSPDIVYARKRVSFIDWMTIFPVSYREDSSGEIKKGIVSFNEEGKICNYKPEDLETLCSFSDIWVDNIKDQQGLRVSQGTLVMC